MLAAKFFHSLRLSRFQPSSDGLPEGFLAQPFHGWAKPHSDG
jgi:hypothetical protein